MNIQFAPFCIVLSEDGALERKDDDKEIVKNEVEFKRNSVRFSNNNNAFFWNNLDD
jgi:hypothetical protein